MSIYVIADLHLSFSNDKPMDIFGKNWENHAEKIKNNWTKKVKEDDYIILPGDFSWAMYLEDTKLDFEYLNSLPGKKILLKGNHDYWWGTTKKINEFLKENAIQNINILYNNSFLIENKIIVGTRGWNLLDRDSDSKMIKRECARLELSINDGITKFGTDKEIIAFLHYPPIIKEYKSVPEKSEFVNILNKYNVTKCYYGHLHGKAHDEAVEGRINGIDYKLVSADYLKFDLLKID